MDSYRLTAEDEAANGEYFPDWEFQTLIGVDRQEVREAATSWLADGVISDDALDTTHSVLNNLLGYPHGEIQKIRDVFAKLS